MINLPNLNQTLEIHRLRSRSERNKEEIGLNDFSDFQILRKACLRSRGGQKGGTAWCCRDAKSDDSCNNKDSVGMLKGYLRVI